LEAFANRAMPDRPMLVAMFGSLLHPLGLLAPLVLGLVADHLGLRAALLILILQPVALLLLAVLPTSRRARERTGGT